MECMEFKIELQLFLKIYFPSLFLYTLAVVLIANATAASEEDLSNIAVTVVPDSISQPIESKIILSNPHSFNLKSKFISSGFVSGRLNFVETENIALNHSNSADIISNSNRTNSTAIKSEDLLSLDRKFLNKLDDQFVDYGFLAGSTSNKESESLQNSECVNMESREVRKASGRCFLRKMPGESCEQSEECADVGGAAYYCIQKRCALPLECPPGHAHVGPACVPYAVTGGECAHPIQCLSGSLCMRGKCRGPCDDNQLFIGDECVDYEGAGCIARSCVDGVCPRAFPTCNWVPQKKNYLCCERKIRMSEQCPHPSSVPQVDLHTGEIAHCFDNNCAPGYTCQFSRYRYGSYICCSNLPSDFPQTSGDPTPAVNGNLESKAKSGPFQSLKTLGPLPTNVRSNGHVPDSTLPPSSSSSIEILKRCCADPECLRKHQRIQIICVRILPQPPRLLGIDP